MHELPSSYDILGIGGPILDQILAVSEDYMRLIPGKAKGMMPVDFPTLKKIIHESGSHPITALGGSARNVMSGMARLGNRSGFCGKIGRDSAGAAFRSLMEQRGIALLLSETETPTATALVLVTPTGARTCRTFLGASAEMLGKDLNPLHFQNVKLVHIEGYTLYNQDLAETAMRYARQAKAKISFDLASFEIVHHFRPQIIRLLKEYVDVVFVNELEAAALTGSDEWAASNFLADLCPVAVVMLGARGCLVNNVHFPAYTVKPQDTTGAGDLFASGFLHGYLQGESFEKCAHYGATVAQAVVQTMGAEIPEESWAKILSQL